MNRFFIVFLTGILLSFQASSQQVDTLGKKLDSLREKTDTVKQINNTNEAAFTENTAITFSSYFVLLGSNMKQSFTKPFHMKKKDWLNVGKFLAITIPLTFADKPIQRNAIMWADNSKVVRDVSDHITRFGGMYEVYTLALLAADGFITKNRKLQTTTLLATQSYMTAGAVQLVAKFLIGRQRPSYADDHTLGAEPHFQGPFYRSTDANGNKTNSSFPSGHATAAFSAATVYSLEYKDKPWVPVVSYTFATLIGLSRITENKHWLTDLVAGAALGYLTGQQVVNNYHRYAKIRNTEIETRKKKRGMLSFNIGLTNGVVTPGLAYNFY